MAVLRNEKPWHVSTNFILAEVRPTGADSPCWRYNRAYEMLEQNDGDLSQAAAMSLLQDVSQRNTMWSIAYNVTNGDILVAMGRQYDQIHSFRLNTRE